ncbi:hypothetical protein [Pedobacter gandavensis]|uniref:Uncharacterized protein n=1 Tax=Pedobacter gandavensis TaxID=2679963 RepID=A0ABR6EUJ7_9SPHI|nr:hypothetical protein [Pedobacter gandavensis]MBB2148930.1 hypothetical protein [Pedobacter gandavensis]
MRIFREQPIGQLFRTTLNNIEREIQGLSEQKLLNADLETLATEIATKYKINPELSISTENLSPEVKMEPIPNMRRYFVATVKYGFPIQGNADLFKYQPHNQTHIGDIRGEIINNRFLMITIWTRWSTPELNEKTEREVKAQITNQIEDVNSNIERVKLEAEEFNNSITAPVLASITTRKAEIIEKNKRRDRLNPFN